VSTNYFQLVKSPEDWFQLWLGFFLENRVLPTIITTENLTWKNKCDAEDKSMSCGMPTLKLEY